MSNAPARYGKPAAHEPYPDAVQAIQATPYGLRGFEKFAALLGLKIWPFQRFMLRLYFAGVIELVIIIPKKNGKTTLLAALALYHLLMVKQAEVVIAAASREQAATMHRQATTLILDAKLERRALPGDRREPTRYAGVFEVREGMHVIRFEEGRIRVLSHEARTADGVIPTLALVDELHRHPNGELYAVFRQGLLSGAQMITISTAGAHMDSPLGRLRARAIENYPMDAKGKRRLYADPAGAFALVEWGLTDDDDPADIRAVNSANPAPWRTRELLKALRDAPSTEPPEWLRLTCGLWTEGETAVDPSAWDAARVDIGKVEPGDTVWLAEHPGDSAWIGFASLRDDGRIAVHAEHIGQDRSGSLIERRLVELAGLYDVMEVAHPTALIRSAEEMATAGLPMVLTPYGAVRFAVISSTFHRLLMSGKLMHAGDPAVRAQVLAATSKDSETGWRYLPSPQCAALIAIANACHQASAYDGGPIRMVLPSEVG